MVRAQFHQVQHPTPFFYQPDKADAPHRMSWRPAIPGPNWEADNPSGKPWQLLPLQPSSRRQVSSPKGSEGPLHCTHLQFCPTVLEHGAIPFTMESGPSNFYCFCSARSVSVELSCGQTQVQIHQLALGMSWQTAKPKAHCRPALQCWGTLKPICTALESAVGFANKQTLCFHKTTELLSTLLIRVFLMLRFLDSIGKCHQRPNKKRDLCWGSFDRMDVSYYWLQRKESEPNIIVVFLKHSFGISAWHPPLQKLKILSRLPQHSLKSGMETHCLGEVTHKPISRCTQTHFPHRCRAVPETPL